MTKTPPMQIHLKKSTFVTPLTIAYSLDSCKNNNVPTLNAKMVNVGSYEYESLSTVTNTILYGN